MSGNSMKGFLKGSSGIYALKTKTTCIGQRADSDLCLKNGGIEERHAVIELSDSENCFVLRDLNSVNGTFVNDCRIQNAAVRLAPGDVLHFGFGGDIYELVVDTASSVFCPPVSHRSAWPGPLQLIDNPKSSSCPASQLPALSTLSFASAPDRLVRGGCATLPRPPVRKRAVSAGSRRVAVSYSTDISSPPTMTRGAWTNTPGRSVGNGLPVSTPQSLELLLQEKEQQILRMQDEVSRLAVSENKSKHKDSIIVRLRDEVAGLKHQLTQTNHPREEEEITQQLVTLGREIKAKKEEIEMLKDQMTKLQKGSSEVVRYSLTERDREIAKLRSEAELLKKDNNIITGLVTSLQREISAKEQQLLRVNAEGEKLRKVIQEKNSQVAAMSAKFSRMRDHQEELVAKEREVVTHEHHVKELESRTKELESENKLLRSQQEDMKMRASEEMQARERLQDELEGTKLQLQEISRREHLVRVELEQAQARLERFRSRILQSTYSAPGVQSPKEAVTDQQVIEQMKQIIEERAAFKEKLKHEVDTKAVEEEERLSNVEGLRRALEESEVHLHADFRSRVKQELETLQALSVDQSLLWVQKVTIGILSSALSWLNQLEQSLMDAGLDVSSCEGGISRCVQLMQENFRKAEQQVKVLQEQMDQMENARDRDRQEHQNALQAIFEQQMKEEFKSWQSEVEEQHKQQLAETLALEKEKGLRAVEEEQRRHKETELHLQELRESEVVKCQEVEALKWQLMSVSQALEEAKKTEVTVQEELSAQKRCQVTESQELRNQIGIERRNHQKETAEFKEQIRQHSWTIVSLEERLLTITKQQRTAEGERGQLEDKLKDALKELEELGRNQAVEASVQPSSPVITPVVPDVPAQDQVCTLLQKELEECRMQILAQQEVIMGLRKDLASTNAKMSDLAGELSEKQKVELEQNRALVCSQALELNHLRQQLVKMSQLVEKKNEELQSRTAELRACKEKMDQQKAAKKEKDVQCKKLQQELGERESQRNQGTAHTELQDHVKSDLAMVAAQCKGHRHEEVIQRQREAMAELRARIKTLEQGCSPRTTQEEALQHLTVLKKQLADLQIQRMLSNNETPGRSAQSHDEAEMKQRSDSFDTCQGSIERSALLEMSDALDLSERTYLDLVRGLSGLLDVKELSGSLLLKHIPQDERQKLEKARERDGELMTGRIVQLKSRLERKDELLGNYEKDLKRLRCSQIALHKKQADVESLQERLQSQIEENSLIRESMERMQMHFDQEKKLNKGMRQRKTIHAEQLDGKRTKSPSHSCVKEDIHGKTEARRKMMEEKLKRRDYEIEILKRELRKQGQDLCDTTTQLVNLQNSLVCRHHAKIY
ncbi:forkhead-associated domain-containing protein 1-like isoform X2 [Narcine bancroftii]|uniref:forkhead-associated domain-containing protein 1-like isoform X2 n=1 Tax=Narcine bancroftii TaxID=1343680 RepID=UPI003831C713